MGIQEVAGHRLDHVGGQRQHVRPPFPRLVTSAARQPMSDSSSRATSPRARPVAPSSARSRSNRWTPSINAAIVRGAVGGSSGKNQHLSGESAHGLGEPDDQCDRHVPLGFRLSPPELSVLIVGELEFGGHAVTEQRDGQRCGVPGGTQ